MPARLALVAVAALRVAADNVSTSKLDPELRVGDLAASEIAVHILATSKVKPGRAGSGEEYDYVEERLLAGARTWGRGFPRLSYIVGSSDDLDDMAASEARPRPARRSRETAGSKTRAKATAAMCRASNARVSASCAFATARAIITGRPGRAAGAKSRCGG